MKVLEDKEEDYNNNSSGYLHHSPHKVMVSLMDNTMILISKSIRSSKRMILRSRMTM